MKCTFGIPRWSGDQTGAAVVGLGTPTAAEKAKITAYKDFGKKGGGVTQVDVEFKGVTKDFFTKDLKTGEMMSVPTNRFRVEGTGNSVKVFPINPNRE